MGMTACQDKSYEVIEPILAPVNAESIAGELVGDDYIWTWPASPDQSMEVTVLRDGTTMGKTVSTDGKYVHSGVETKVPYTYVFKLTDGNNYSTGVIKEYLRGGADAVKDIMMKQVEKANGYDAAVEWTASPDASQLFLTATCGAKTVNETLAGSATAYTIPDVTYGEEWEVTIVASNSDGKSLPSTGSLKIGKTAVGFLSEYPTEADLLADGDDDEASAWLWTKSEYPNATYIYFGDITSAATLEPYRVLFWMRDLEDKTEDDVFNMPSVVENATPAVREWYKDGGSLLLWSHATAYIGTLGRLEKDMLRNNDRSIGIGKGGWNGDTWKMAVQLHPGSKFKKDASTHPIFKGLDVEETDRTKLIAFKGAGWTEDHNCLYFNIPSVLTGLGNQEEACYNALTTTYGIVPLGTWDSQIDWVSQLNVWEARQGNTEFKGTILCIGNGGCEFSLKNADGTPDISAYPKNNPYQNNVLTLAKNSIEYLKTR
ncbi:MAG: DUF4960 domain-containing protein [Muribaculaceae bacterium]|nr:DUF4960 domain-containing protein [Muribaculaceae bacterium]